VIEFLARGMDPAESPTGFDWVDIAAAGFGAVVLGVFVYFLVRLISRD
jgi:hypothetical protein